MSFPDRVKLQKKVQVTWQKCAKCAKCAKSRQSAQSQRKVRKVQRQSEKKSKCAKSRQSAQSAKSAQSAQSAQSVGCAKTEADKVRKGKSAQDQPEETTKPQPIARTCVRRLYFDCYIRGSSSTRSPRNEISPEDDFECLLGSTFGYSLEDKQRHESDDSSSIIEAQILRHVLMRRGALACLSIRRPQGIRYLTYLGSLRIGREVWKRLYEYVYHVNILIKSLARTWVDVWEGSGSLWIRFFFGLYLT